MPSPLPIPTSKKGTLWIVLFLLVGVGAPSAAVLWFTNRAADREAEAARREIVDARRRELVLLRDRIDAHWSERAKQLSEVRDPNELIAKGLADAAIFFDEHGQITQPVRQLAAGDSPPNVAEWSVAERLENRGRDFATAAKTYETIAMNRPAIAAEARQAMIRCLLESGDKAQAVISIERYFLKEDGGAAPRGRGIRGNELLLGVNIATSAAQRHRFLNALRTLLLDYKHSLLSAQRIFLMRSATASGAGPFPAFEAEQLAAQFLQSDQPRIGDGGLQPTNLKGVWKLASSNGRTLALFRTDSIAKAFPDAAVIAAPPGSALNETSVPAGSMLPGWQLAHAAVNRDGQDLEANRRRATYAWTGYVVVVLLVTTGLLLAGLMRRKMTLAQLKTDTMAAVAHELKTPLASIQVLVDALLDHDQFDPDKVREYLKLISGQNQRLTDSIESFLTFSRLQRGRLRLVFHSEDPNQIAQAAIAAVRARYEQAGGSVTLEADAGLPAVHADRVALTSALINLLDNAYKYSPSNKHTLLRVTHEEDRVVFAVVDRGIGIPASEQTRIFREFYRVDQSLSSETSGAGLGLSLVSGIVRQHGGEVRLKSAPGEGSTFVILLPGVQ